MPFSQQSCNCLCTLGPLTGYLPIPEPLTMILARSEYCLLPESEADQPHPKYTDGVGTQDIIIMSICKFWAAKTLATSTLVKVQ